MALPKITKPIFYTKLPSTGESVQYHPMTVADERNLLIAKESKDDTDIFTAVYQVVNNCMINFNMNKISMADLEFLFLKIRGSSISNIINVSYIDNEDEKQYDFAIDITNVEVKDNQIDKKIMITEDTGLLMKYPPATLYTNKDFLANVEDDNNFLKFVYFCTDKVFDKDEVYPEFDEKEFVEWLSDVPVEVYEKLRLFVLNIPRLEYVIKYTNSKGTAREIVLSTLNDFFTLR